MKVKVIEGQLNLFDLLNQVIEIKKVFYVGLLFSTDKCSWCGKLNNGSFTYCQQSSKLYAYLCNSCENVWISDRKKERPIFECYSNGENNGYVFCTDNFERVKDFIKENRSKQKLVSMFEPELKYGFNVLMKSPKCWYSDKKWYQKQKKWRD